VKKAERMCFKYKLIMMAKTKIIRIGSGCRPPASPCVKGSSLFIHVLVLPISGVILTTHSSWYKRILEENKTDEDANMTSVPMK